MHFVVILGPIKQLNKNIISALYSSKSYNASYNFQRREILAITNHFPKQETRQNYFIIFERLNPVDSNLYRMSICSFNYSCRFLDTHLSPFVEITLIMISSCPRTKYIKWA